VSPSTPTFSRRIPEGEERLRHVCDHCGFVDYRNPRVVVGAVCLYRDRVLLCRRAIEPRVGYWTIPSGFLELGESCAEGAAREAREEAGVEIEIDALLALYDVPRIGHVHLIYRARLRHGLFHRALGVSALLEHELDAAHVQEPAFLRCGRHTSDATHDLQHGLALVARQKGHHGLVAQAPELIERAFRHQLSAGDDQRSLAHRFDLREDVRRQKDGVLAAQVADQAADL
jgi:ADP-ribose pyrophosphatase YjhB (NUDIX family)